MCRFMSPYAKWWWDFWVKPSAACNVFALNFVTESVCEVHSSALDSGIDVAHGINVAPGTFVKNIKRSP